MEVVSEILPTFELDLQTSPTLDKKHAVSKFKVRCPIPGSLDGKSRSIEKDKDGDYIIDREEIKEVTLLIEHSVSTTLDLVGLQIWRGAFLLADLMIHLRHHLRGQTVVELGGGVGLTSLVAAVYAENVICTDLDAGLILQLLRQNVLKNRSILRNDVQVHGLDWFDLNWNPELEKGFENATIIIAADVVYDNKVTEAFVRTITKILSTPPKKTLYIALEKRYVFTVEDMDTVAPCYEHLLSCFKEVSSLPPWSQWTITQVPIDFPQYTNYERCKQLVLWSITS